MLIYGTNSVHLKTDKSQTATCPSCGTQGEIITSVHSKHAHVYWVPLFAMGKFGAAQCQHCSFSMEESEMPESVKREYDDLKSESRIPFWQFSGLGVILGLVIFFYFAGKKDKKDQLAYLSEPAIGDVYNYKSDNQEYSTMKVVNVASDSVFVTPNEYVIDKRTQVNKINKAENYADFSYGISKADLKKMYDDEEIYDVNR